MNRRQENRARYVWLLLLPLVFVLYAWSFSSFPAIEREHSVLADADSSNYIRLQREFGLTSQYGDPYTHTDQGRSIGDNAQKHKIHHSMYFIVGGVLYNILAALYGLVGLAPTQAVFAVNAVVACLSLILLRNLLREFNPHGNPALPFLVFYAAALSTWVFGSIPESWPFSGALILAFLLVYYRHDAHYLTLAALIGVIMMNNMILAFLLCFVLIRLVQKGHGILGSLGRCFIAGLISIGVWLSLLTVLSLLDPAYRPDEYVKYTFWFRDFTKPDLNMLDPFVWKSVLSNLFVTSVVSNQADPFVPQEALLYTLRSSGLGIVATAAYLIGLIVAGIAFVREVREDFDPADPLPSLLKHRGVHLVAFSASIVMMTLLLFYPSGFLYSTTVLALIALFLCRCLNLETLSHRIVFYAMLALMLINNTVQILRFRESLAILT